MKKISKLFFLPLLSLGICSCSRTAHEGVTMKINSIADVVALFPKTQEEIMQRVERTKQQASTAIAAIIAIPAEKRTFKNTAQALDRASHLFSAEVSSVNMLEHVSPDEKLRDASRAASLQLREFAIDLFGNNQELYQAFKTYAEGNAQKESLTNVERYFLDETMSDFKRNGLALPAEELAEVTRLKKKLAGVELQFSANIANGQRSVKVTQSELTGLDDDFIKSLKREGDVYVLGTDYPTYTRVLEQCDVEATRKKIHRAYMQRAYPENMAVLDDMIAYRDELARRLGFESYAALNLDDQMAKTQVRVETFISDLVEKAKIKAEQEFELLTAQLPENITLTSGKLKPWDFSYLLTNYKKKHFDLDEQKIAEYFPMEKTIQGLLNIYEQFMNITLKEVPAAGLWHTDVKMVEVYSGTPRILRGYLILDLYPRENKYNHAASFTILSSVKDAQGVPQPAVDVVVTNFPKSTPTKPSLLKHQDVETFFHEFGHAIHTILGGTELASFSGTHVKTDFVEMPSQMLEEWMWDPQMLKQVSGHYITKASLPDALIEKKIELKNLTSGNFILRQMFFAQLSLDYFKPGTKKNTQAIEQQLHEQLRSHIAYEPETYIQASFGHLDEYGAKYYGYMWSKVFALDLFDKIKEQGLLNPSIGQRYVNEILAQGGSQDPNDLLHTFLGRPPNQDAFLRSVGLGEKMNSVSSDTISVEVVAAG